MNVTLRGSYPKRGATLFGDNGWNFWNSDASHDRTYTAQKALAVDYTTDSGQHMPYDSLSVYAIVDPYQKRTTPDGVYQGSAGELKALETKLIMVQKANESYIAAARSYYDTRVSRTSGGKRARLRDERAMLINEATYANKIAAAAILDLRNKKLASEQSQMTTDPDNIVLVNDPQSGRTNYTASTVNPGSSVMNAPTPKPAAQSNLGALLLIPVGIAAAYLLAKGH